MNACQTVDGSVDVRQQRRHRFQLESLESPNSDSKDDVDGDEGDGGDRKCEQEPRQDGGHQDDVDGDVEQRSHRVVGKERQPSVH